MGAQNIETSIPSFLKGQRKINDECGKVIFVGDVQGPEKVHNTCVKTMHAGSIDKGFTVLRC
jgi:hypothetical protein